jgi:hypothetical protein
MDELEKRVLAELRAADRPLCAQEIAMSGDMFDQRAVRRALYRLCQAGQIEKAGEKKLPNSDYMVPVYQAAPSADQLSRICEFCGYAMGEDNGTVCSDCISECESGGDLTRSQGDDEPYIETARRLAGTAPQTDQICAAIDRISLGAIYGASEDARVLRHLAFRLSNIDPIISDRLILIASKLEARADAR